MTFFTILKKNMQFFILKRETILKLALEFLINTMSLLRNTWSGGVTKRKIVEENLLKRDMKFILHGNFFFLGFLHGNLWDINCSIISRGDFGFSARPQTGNTVWYYRFTDRILLCDSTRMQKRTFEKSYGLDNYPLILNAILF